MTSSITASPSSPRARFPHRPQAAHRHSHGVAVPRHTAPAEELERIPAAHLGCQPVDEVRAAHGVVPSYARRTTLPCSRSARFSHGTAPWRQCAHRPGRKPHFDHLASRRRSAIERTVGALKEAPAVATRYQKLANHYLALVQISMIGLLVHRLEGPLSQKA